MAKKKSKKIGKPKKIKKVKTTNKSATKKDINRISSKIINVDSNVKKVHSNVKNVNSNVKTLIDNSNIIKTLENKIISLFSDINVNTIGWTTAKENFTYDNISYDEDNIPDVNPNQHPTGLNPPVSISGGLIKQNQAYKNLYQTYNNETGIKTNEIDFLKKTELTGMDVSYEAIKKQNILLDDQIQTNKGVYSTYDKQSFYKQEKIDTFKKMNFILYLLFYICLIGLIYMMFINETFSIYQKIGIVFAFMIYPYVIRIIEKMLIFLFDYFIAIVNGDVYNSRNL